MVHTTENPFKFSTLGTSNNQHQVRGQYHPPPILDKKKIPKPVKVLLQRQSNPAKHCSRHATTPKSPLPSTVEQASTSASHADIIHSAERITASSQEVKQEIAEDGDDDDDNRDTSFFSMDRTAKLTLLSLAVVDFTAYLSMSIIAPFFPKTANEKGMSDTVSGFVFGIYALVMFLGCPIIGMLLPRIGPKFVFLSGMFVTGICNVLFGLLVYAHDGFEFTVLCFIVRIFEALGAAGFTTATYAIIIDIYPDNIGTVFGVLETFVGLGMMVGPAIGGVLYKVGGFILPFSVVGGFIIFVCWPLNAWLLPSYDEKCNPAPPSDMLKLLKIPSVLLVCISISAGAAVWGFLDPILEPQLRKFDIGPEYLGLIFMVIATSYALFSPVWGYVADRMDNTKGLIIAGLLIMMVALLFLGPSPLIPFLPDTLWLVIASLAVLGMANSLALIPTFENILDAAEIAGLEDNLSTYGLLAALWATAYSLGEFIGPTAGGALYESIGFEWGTTAVACFLLVLAVVFIVLCVTEWVREKSKKEQQLPVVSEKTPLLKKCGSVGDLASHQQNGAIIKESCPECQSLIRTSSHRNKDLHALSV
ncbi:PREDICTED: MFS-type transporter SLC18B1-like [Priapulus caudatus]|uniref:MFS-type transporter SLC18B1-like n=1 Tax=Priapulus caudatus TaxID=37621 RepID=A0ABM1FBH0_PRICU|nr:PREDICTED: MFS-type transporter SLC18B1-like [Priapulus caudatus]XP_014681785.1 PREDICTED: MFS-type transporter SLC18B1-like [Priapulus caudatus]XP_014681791.1 PREDICTED: MFS-type transporter SLC18B1-like [Priapulus caudatus]XP_014681798.1 PREDICTED: MFS-type transporter SLC18B1-like [Priapulus caudatus]XP_014681807.1 PREDICTED: MFS-type transporter SLC18B1-like [Priapulus caudatus]XP_014681816.1 PREDICTED: MFS-type transporter SLC18B1-like [Priapulus caudatus]